MVFREKGEVAMSKSWPRVEMRINLRAVLFDKLESAIEYGWNRAHKHTETPTPDVIKEHIYTAVTSAIYDVLAWGDDDDGDS